jgi:hypothetical protein
MNNEVVILLDTGIDKSAFKNSLVGGKHFYVEGRSIYCDDNFDDDNGHGSACAYIIKSVFPSAQFYVIKILDRNAETIYPILETALEYCLNLEYHLINLSLAMLDDNVNSKFSKLCDKLRIKGKILLSSVHNGYRESYPASYRSVIGVRGSRFFNSENYWYNPNNCIQCIADISPSFTDRSLYRYFMFGGNSKACALVSGLILKAENINNILLDFESANLILEKNAQKNEWNESDINTSVAMLTIDDYSLCGETLLKSICHILYSTMDWNNQESVGWRDNLFESGLVQPAKIKQLIQNLEKHFGVNIPNSYINYNSLCSINMIGKMIEGAKSEKIKIII